MVSDDPILSDEGENIASSVADKARYQRRRAAFRRRLTSSLIGVALVIGLVLWQRNRSYLHRCEASLRAYGNAAMKMHLEREPEALIDSTWDAMKIEAALSPSHYTVLTDNWLKQPESGESIPLALCEEPHGSLTGSGRYVLYRTVNGLEVRWVAEAEAEKLAKGSKGASD